MNQDIFLYWELYLTISRYSWIYLTDYILNPTELSFKFKRVNIQEIWIDQEFNEQHSLF